MTSKLLEQDTSAEKLYILNELVTFHLIHSIIGTSSWKSSPVRFEMESIRSSPGTPANDGRFAATVT